MADSFTTRHLQGVFGKFVPVIDETVDFSADNFQGIFGQFTVVLDEAAGAAPVAVPNGWEPLVNQPYPSSVGMVPSGPAPGLAK